MRSAYTNDPKLGRLMTAVIVTMVSFAVLVPQRVDALSSSTILNLINQQRQNRNLYALRPNSQLNSSAYAKARDMLAKQYFGHVSPSGQAAWHFIGATGYAYTAASENLAQGFTSDSAVITSWMASAIHRSNMLSSTYRDIGVAAVSGTLSGRATTLVVAHFAVPRTQTQVVRTAPVAARTPSTVSQPSAQPVSPRRQTATKVQPKTRLKPVAKKRQPSIKKALWIPGPELNTAYVFWHVPLNMPTDSVLLTQVLWYSSSTASRV